MSDNKKKDSYHECAIVDDDSLSCDRLKDILKRFDSLRVMGCYNTYQMALEQVLSSRPKVIFLDVELDRNHTAFELIEQFHAVCYFPLIILVTAYNHYSIKAIKKGVFDYLVKPVDIDELKETVDRLDNHMSFPYSTLIEMNNSLTEREKEVLELVLIGKTSQEIANHLYVSKSTVDSHRKSILKKTGTGSLSELMRMPHQT